MISIVIPTYNEERNIVSLLGSLARNGNREVIVVDGGSEDGTADVSQRFPVRLIETGLGRAHQMNAGAGTARGEGILFLHADCRLEEGSLEAVERTLRAGFVGGGLTQRITSGRIVYRSIEASGNLRARLFGIFYGDQAIFARRDVFRDIGGFDDVELFEDVLFSRKLSRAGRVALLDKKVYTSPRRWESRGTAKATAINWLVTAGFMMGVSPTALRKFYGNIRYLENLHISCSYTLIKR